MITVRTVEQRVTSILYCTLSDKCKYRGNYTTSGPMRLLIVVGTDHYVITLNNYKKDQSQPEV